MNKKEFCAKYFKGISNTLITYTIISIFTLIAKITLSNFGIFPLEKFNHYVNDFIDFRLIGYAWYVDMYIGLFLLIPFINKIFTNFKQDFIFILVLLFLTVLPQFTHNPTLIVSSWVDIWPVTYYAIGAFISKYEIKITTKTLSYLFIGSYSICSLINLIIVHGHVWKDINIANNWIGIENIINAVLLFMILQRINLCKIHSSIQNIISGIAKLSLGIYLSSYLFDKIVYFYFNQYITSTPAKLEWYMIIVPFVFVCSLCMAKLADLICKFICKCIDNFTKKNTQTPCIK